MTLTEPEDDMLHSLTEEAELLEADRCCVLFYDTVNIRHRMVEKLVSVSGPFDSVLDAAKYGEHLLPDMKDGDDDSGARYEIRALWPPNA